MRFSNRKKFKSLEKYGIFKVKYKNKQANKENAKQRKKSNKSRQLKSDICTTGNNISFLTTR